MIENKLALGTKVKYIGSDEILRDKVFYIDGYYNEKNKYLLSYEKDHKKVGSYEAIEVDVNDIELSELNE